MSEYDPIDEYDSLAKLYKAQRALIAAGSRGEAVADQLQDVRNSIRSIIESRQQQSAPRQTR